MQEEPIQRTEVDGQIYAMRMSNGTLVISVMHAGQKQDLRCSEYNARRIFGALSVVLELPLPSRISRQISMGEEVHHPPEPTSSALPIRYLSSWLLQDLVCWLLRERAEQIHRLRQHEVLRDDSAVSEFSRQTGRIMARARDRLIWSLNEELEILRTEQRMQAEAKGRA